MRRVLVTMAMLVTAWLRADPVNYLVRNFYQGNVVTVDAADGTSWVMQPGLNELYLERQDLTFRNSSGNRTVSLLSSGYGLEDEIVEVFIGSTGSGNLVLTVEADVGSRRAFYMGMSLGFTIFGAGWMLRIIGRHASPNPAMLQPV